MFHLVLLDRIKFYIERQLAKGALYQLFLAWLIVLILSLLSGLLVTVIHGPEESVSDNIWWAFLRLSDPGYLGDDVGLWRRMISTVLTVLGYVLFMGTIVAIMTQWLFRKMRLLEQGVTPVALRGHYAILGWSSRTLPIVEDILSREGLTDPLTGKRYPIRLAVLADDISAGASAEFYANPYLNRHRRQVVLRSGSVLNPEHIHRVAAVDSRVVIIPARRESSDTILTSDAESLKVLLSLSAMQKDKPLPLAVVELHSAEKVPLAAHSYKGPLQVVASDITIARTFVRSLHSPGVADVLDQLFGNPNGCQLFVSSASGLTGKRWSEACLHYNTAIPCGVIYRRDGKWHSSLAPDDNYVIEATDKLVLLARREQDIVLTAPASHIGQAIPSFSLPVAKVKHLRANKVLLLGWNATVPTFIRQLGADDFGVSQVTLVSTMSADERRELLAESQLNCQVVQADYTRPGVLKELGPQQYDSIIVFASDRLDRGEEADARSIVTNQLLDYLFADDDCPQIIIELKDPNNAVYMSVAQHVSRSEVVQSSAMISHILTQLAIYPELRVVYDELLSGLGANIYLLPVPEKWFGSHSFGSLQQALRQQSEVLLGVKQGSDRVELNLAGDTLIQCQAETKLVVLSRVR